MQQVIRMTTGGYTGADVSAARDATGAIYLTYQQAGQQRVIRRDASGAVAPIALPQQVTGRGQFALFDGELVLVAWNESEGKSAGVCYIQSIPGYVAPAGPTAPGGVSPEKAAELPNGGAAYLDNFDVFGNRTTELTPLSTWADFLRAGWFVLRMNKLVAALAQLQRQARNAGWLE